MQDVSYILKMLTGVDVTSDVTAVRVLGSLSTGTPGAINTRECGLNDLRVTGVDWSYGNNVMVMADDGFEFTILSSDRLFDTSGAEVSTIVRESDGILRNAATGEAVAFSGQVEVRVVYQGVVVADDLKVVVSLPTATGKTGAYFARASALVWASGVSIRINMDNHFVDFSV